MILLVHLVDPVAHPLDLPVQSLLPQGCRLERVVTEDQPVHGVPVLRVTVGCLLELGTRWVTTDPRGGLVGAALVVTRYVLLR